MTDTKSKQTGFRSHYCFIDAIKHTKISTIRGVIPEQRVMVVQSTPISPTGAVMNETLVLTKNNLADTVYKVQY